MKKLLFQILFLLLTIVTAVAQDHKEMGSQMVTNYAPKEYGAFGQNWTITQDERGIMYFGNWGGLLEFDGTFWSLFELPNKSAVNSMAIGADGKIFVGGTNEFGYFVPDNSGTLIFHSLINYIPKATSEFSNVWKTFVEGPHVYFFSSDFIFIWNDQEKILKTINSENGFHNMFNVRNNLYVRELGVGLDVIMGDSLEFLEGSEIFANEKIFVMLPFPGEEGVTLIGIRNMGFFKFGQGIFDLFKTDADQFIADNLIYASGTILSDGNILLGTLRGGAIIMDHAGRVVRKYNVENGIINDNIYSTFQDHSGAIWLATDNGISRIDYASPIVYFDARNKFDAIPLNSTRYNGTILTASTLGVYYLESTTSDFRHLEPLDKQCWTFLELADRLLLGSTDGLFEITYNPAIQLNEIAGSIYSPTVMCRSNLRPDRIYLGAEAGIYLKSKERDVWTDAVMILKNLDQKTSIIEDNDGSIWVGTVSSGLFRITINKNSEGDSLFKNPVVEHFGQNNGLQNSQISVAVIDGKKYFYTLDSIYEFDANHASFYSDKSNHIVQDFYAISQGKVIMYYEQDSEGRIWLATRGKLSMGIQQEDKSYYWISDPFRRFAEDEIYHIYPDKNNLTWICTNAGIIKFDFARLDSSSREFYTTIRDASIGDDSLIYFGGLVGSPITPKIDFIHNSIKFRYSATSYEGKNINSFTTFLDGFDVDWSSWTTQTTKEYTNLPPGTYTFKVKGKNILGQEGIAGTFLFEIIPPWYRTWWAYLFYLVIAGMGLVLADRKRRAYILKKERKQTEFREAKLRAQAIELENKALQAENESKLKELEYSKEIENAYLDLKSTQSQLIQSEKLASLGELTAGIAHEIQNPLNFVNNFSEINKELFEELETEIKKGNEAEISAILKDLKENEEKIKHHGQRADAIVKSMLQHSRISSGEKEPTDINALCDEFLRLTYHGMLAKEKNFNADLITDFDSDLPQIDVVPQEIGRVVHNLISNAFDTVNQEVRNQRNGYKPVVEIRTRKTDHCIEISVRDNGGGIPENIQEKIFQPFFTTKPTGQGTGLGLSLSYDIIKAHGGEIKVDSEVGKGSKFVIILPL